MKKSNTIALTLLATAGIGTLIYNTTQDDCNPNNASCYSSGGSGSSIKSNSSTDSISRGGFGHSFFSHFGGG